MEAKEIAEKILSYGPGQYSPDDAHIVADDYLRLRTENEVLKSASLTETERQNVTPAQHIIMQETARRIGAERQIADLTRQRDEALRGCAEWGLAWDKLTAAMREAAETAEHSSGCASLLPRYEWAADRTVPYNCDCFKSRFIAAITQVHDAEKM